MQEPVMLDVALALAGRYGFCLFPIREGCKFPPLVKDWPKNATSNSADIKDMWALHPEANIGIHTKGLLVVDVDVKNGGLEAYSKLNLPITMTNTTPTGGLHVIYRLPAGHPGVPNSVGKLGPGLDIRSTNGYIVGPGSIVPAGKYRLAKEHRIIEPAPQWLIDKLGEIKSDPQRREVNVPDAPKHIVEQARLWIIDQDAAIEGAAGDSTTYRVCAGLHDFGLSIDQAMDLLDNWNAECSPPWEYKELRAKLVNAYRYSQTEPGSRVALPSEFEITEEEVEAKEVLVHGLQMRSLSELVKTDTRGKPYLIKDILLQGSFAQVFGKPGAGKTFVTLDMAYCIAAGLEWFGHKVKQGPVVYLSFEGSSGIPTRAKALARKYGKADVPLYQLDASGLDLRQKSDRAQLIEAVKSLPQKPVLMVIDTFHRALQGGDENSSQDVGHYLAAVGGFIGKGITVMQIHHPGKQEGKGARGSSAIFGALDTEIHLFGGAVHVTKQRELEIGEALGYRLAVEEVGRDDEGDPITTCTVAQTDLSTVEEFEDAPRAKYENLTEKQRAALEALIELDPNNVGVHVNNARRSDKDIDRRILAALREKGVLCQKAYDKNQLHKRTMEE